MISAIKSALTGPDNATYDEIKIAFVAGIFALIAFTGWGVLAQHQPFNSIEFCGGFATLATATGLTSSAKQLAKAMPPARAEKPSGDPQ